MAQFNSANQQAIAALKQYVVYLKEQKLPKANDHYALGREKYIELLRYGEMVTLSPNNCWRSAPGSYNASSRSLRRPPGKLTPRKARRSLPGHPKGPSHRAKPDSRHRQGPRSDPPVCD